GLLGMSLMGGGLWGVGFAIVDMRIRKVLKRFLATPMRKSDFLLALMVSRMILLAPEVFVLLVFSRLAFGVVIQGSLLAMAVLILLGAVTFAGIGLLVASRAKTLEAVSGLMNLVMLPMWVLSGIFFSPERFPAAAQPFIQALPLTPLIDALRAVSLEGAGLASQWRGLAILAAGGGGGVYLALRGVRGDCRRCAQGRARGKAASALAGPGHGDPCLPPAALAEEPHLFAVAVRLVEVHRGGVPPGRHPRDGALGPLVVLAAETPGPEEPRPG